MIRSKPSNYASIILALLPIPLKYHFKGHGKSTAVKGQHIHGREVLRKVFELIFCPPDALFKTGKHMLCAAGWTWQCILSSVHRWLTTSKPFPCTRSSSPIALCANHWNHGLEKGIHCHGNWQTISYTSKGWYSPLTEMRWRDGKQDNIRKIQRLEP